MEAHFGGAFLVGVPISRAFAAHPLITDDTGTQGRSGFQLELNGMFGYDRGKGATERADEAGVILSCGLWETGDLAVDTPYERIRTEDDGVFNPGIVFKHKFQ
ncbi:MAG: hypothetical protein HYY46_03870 [Deltaproteobacteria bacterium]|nr:hypothetical protein [Deltaproteobacteria bacterium]